MVETLVERHGRRVPYSKWLMAQSLSALGLAPERAYALARRLEQRLRERGRPIVDVAELGGLTEEVLAAEEGADAVRRFHAWRRLGHLDRPLIVLISGTAGVGKSTLATMLAGRLGLTRVIPTDVIRQVLRSCFSHEFLPAVHYSSFEAGRAVELPTGGHGDADLVGFARQAEIVLSGVSAVLERGAEEATSMVVEGVHLVPGALAPSLRERCVLVEALLVVEDEERHRAHFPLRMSGRPAERYLRGLPEIRKLQDYLVERAQHQRVPVVENDSIDRALAAVMRLALQALERPHDPGGGVPAAGAPPTSARVRGA